MGSSRPTKAQVVFSTPAPGSRLRFGVIVSAPIRSLPASIGSSFATSVNRASRPASPPKIGITPNLRLQETSSQRHLAGVNPTNSSIPSAPDRRRIAALATMPERQVLRVYRNPSGCRPSILDRVERAAEQLGLSPPLVEFTVTTPTGRQRRERRKP